MKNQTTVLKAHWQTNLGAIATHCHGVSYWVFKLNSSLHPSAGKYHWWIWWNIQFAYQFLKWYGESCAFEAQIRKPY